MHKIKYLFFILLSVSIIISCEKEYSDETGTPRVLNPFESCIGCTYYPLCNGIIYNYEDSIKPFGSAITSLIVKDTMKNLTDVMFKGLNARKRKEATYESLTTCFNGEVNIAVTSPLLTINGIDTLKSTPLKYNNPINTTWTDRTSVVVAGTLYILDNTRKVVSRKASTLINGVTFTDIVEVQTNSSETTGSLPPSVTSDIYARNIGLVYSKNVQALVTTERFLKTYFIP